VVQAEWRCCLVSAVAAVIMLPVPPGSERCHCDVYIYGCITAAAWVPKVQPPCRCKHSCCCTAWCKDT
jgi:hypothetical protein